MKYYRTFSTVPDFSRPPVAGVHVPREDVDIAGAAIRSRWPAHPARTQTLSFTRRGPTEVAELRRFLRAVRGNWEAFHVPSWYRDFGAKGDAAPGVQRAYIDRDPTPWLIEDRPDTYGRTLYFYAAPTQLHVARIVEAVDQGDGWWKVELDSPFQFSADLEKCLCGIAWFARFAGPEYRFAHLTPDRLSVEAGIIEVRHLRREDRDHEITSAAIYDSNPFEDVQERDLDPAKNYFREFEALGPDFYRTPQIPRFYRRWRFWIEAGTVYFSRGTALYTSDLYDGGDAVAWITAAFDTAGNEALAWAPAHDEIRLRWLDGGVMRALDLEGARTPVLFQNWIYDGDLNAGDADVILYYTRAGESKVFARYQRDEFAIEHDAVLSPVQPLALTGIEIDDRRLLLQGISANHTRLTYRSTEIDTPVPEPPFIVVDGTGGSVQLSGAYTPAVVDVLGTEGAGGRVILSGAVKLTARDAVVVDGTGGSVQLSGAYERKTVDPVPVPHDLAGGTAHLSGTVELIAKDSTAQDNAGGNVEITGTYEPDPQE